ncbi:trigger factor [Atopobium sp. oral taxon 199]|uniref:trigger factor n=1 Tax=Atopobium sp. oral taxon 199 TaxID=712156 RepID=UPI00034E3D57|nr:trigger factor [Atopobium sp. oral taxon 199]EPD78175.1 trigger factor [Atopobium sp. oral taxon 199 str. F0494]
MNITVTADKPKDQKLAVKVTIPAADVDAAVKQAYKDIAYKYSFQGFRKGKAPRPVIDSIVGREAVLAQATNDLLGTAEPQVLEELDLVPIGQGDYGKDDNLANEGKDYTYEVTFNVRPDAQLDSYDAPAITMPPEEATEAEIDRQIKTLLSYQTTFENTKEKRAAKEGDVVSLDIENIEGAAHMAGEGRTITLNGTQIPEEFQKELIGMKPGEEKEIKWTHSHTHGDEVHSHDYDIKVTFVAHKKAVTPELTDEFAKKNFGFDTVEKLRDAVKEEIEADKKNSLPTLKEDRVVEEMGKRLQLDEVPAEYKNEIFNEIAQEFLNNLQRQGATLDMFLAARGIKTDDFIKDLQEQADERARQSLALDAIARNQDIKATNDDVRAEFEKAGVKDVEKTIEEWRSAGRLPAIRESIRRSKALDWLRDNAQVTVKDEIAEQDAEAAKGKKAEKKTTAKKEKAVKKDKDAQEPAKDAE